MLEYYLAGEGSLGERIDVLKKMWRDRRLALWMLVMLAGMSKIALVDGIVVKE